jgi:transposase
MNRNEARRLMDRIGKLCTRARATGQSLDAIETELVEAIELASTSNCYELLGYSSWVAWIVDAITVEVRNRDERKRLAELMIDNGMSMRAISRVLHVDVATISRDLEGYERPDTVTGLDGKAQTHAGRPRSGAVEKTVVRSHLRSGPSQPNSIHVEFGVSMMREFRRVAKSEGRTVEDIAREAIRERFAEIVSAQAGRRRK